MQVYKMNSPKRGRALIINNKNFPSSSQPERHGTDIDATNIDQLLGHLGYITRLVGDLTAMVRIFMLLCTFLMTL